MKFKKNNLLEAKKKVTKKLSMAEEAKAFLGSMHVYVYNAIHEMEKKNLKKMFPSANAKYLAADAKLYYINFADIKALKDLFKKYPAKHISAELDEKSPNFMNGFVKNKKGKDIPVGQAYVYFGEDEISIEGPNPSDMYELLGSYTMMEIQKEKAKIILEQNKVKHGR